MAIMDEEDPFACFDESDDDDDDSKDDDNKQEHNHNHDNSGNGLEHKPIRDATCGVLAFHPNTERSLLLHVENELKALHSTSLPDKNRQLQQQTSIDTTTEEAVLRSIDTYCLDRHWMMHVGPQKGKVVKEFLSQCMDTHFQDTHDDVTPCPSTNNMKSKKSFVAVELGTYCGYSSILLVQKAKQYIMEQQLHKEEASSTSSLFHLYTVEVDPTHVNIARNLIRLAQLEDFITVLELCPGKTTLNELLQENIPTSSSSSSSTCSRPSPSSPRQQPENKNEPLHNQVTYNNDHHTPHPIDFLFVDHDKDLYLSDLQHLEQTGWIQAGTYVAADNVIFAQIDNYREYVQTLSQKGIVQTRLEDAQIEYCEPEQQQQQQQDQDNIFRDGIEFTIYEKDPLA